MANWLRGLEIKQYWYEHRGELLSFADYLVCDQHFTAKQILGVFEKPWKWDDEYKSWKNTGSAYPED
jgi:hypothetical protein